MSTSETNKDKRFVWFKFYPADWIEIFSLPDKEVAKTFRNLVKRLASNKAPKDTIEFGMINESISYAEKRRINSMKRWHPEQFMEQEPEKTETQAQQPTHQETREATDSENGNASDDCKATKSVRPVGSPPPQCVIDAQRRAPRPTAKPSKPRDREEFKQFVAAADLHIGLSEEWYEISAGRGWTFQDGSPIRDWRAAVTNYCHKVEQQRNSTQEK